MASNYFVMYISPHTHRQYPCGTYEQAINLLNDFVNELKATMPHIVVLEDGGNYTTMCVNSMVFSLEIYNDSYKYFIGEH